MIKQNLSISMLACSLLLTLSSCEAIGAIFKAGVWSGVLMVVILVALVIFVISKMFGGKKE